MSRFSFVLTLCLSVTAAYSQSSGEWRPIRPGVDLSQGSFKDRDQTVKFVALRIDPRQNQVRVVDTFQEIGRSRTSAAFSLREVQSKTKALIVVNAGSTASFALPAPVGLLKTRGKVVSAPNYLAKVDQPGIFCVIGNRVAIMPLLPQLPNCIDAVQRYPVLSADSSQVETSRSQRTVVAVDGGGRLLIFVTLDKTTLSGVAAFLYRSTPTMNIQSALNLDGGPSSGLILAGDPTGNGQTFGNIDGLVASAITISGASRPARH